MFALLSIVCPPLCIQKIIRRTYLHIYTIYKKKECFHSNVIYLFFLFKLYPVYICDFVLSNIYTENLELCVCKGCAAYLLLKYCRKEDKNKNKRLTLGWEYGRAGLGRVGHPPHARLNILSEQCTLYKYI